MFIARERSYHGATLGAIGVSGYTMRRMPFEGILKDNVRFVTPCFPYRYQQGRTNDEYVQHLKEELKEMIETLGPENVAAFIAEPIVGAVSAFS